MCFVTLAGLQLGVETTLCVVSIYNDCFNPQARLVPHVPISDSVPEFNVILQLRSRTKKCRHTHRRYLNDVIELYSVMTQ